MKKTVKAGATSVTSARPPQTHGDPQGRASIEDHLLFNNIRILGFPNALRDWQELVSFKVEMTQCMFDIPNKSATETLLYFLLASLIGRDGAEKEFKHVWPPVDPAASREFKNRVVELIKGRSQEWKISDESKQLLPAMLQRQSGAKLVRLLCELSNAVMEMNLKKAFPGVQVPEDDVELPSGFEGAILEKMIEGKITMGKAKTSGLRNGFLERLAEAKAHRQETQQAAAVLNAHYSKLQTEEASLSKELETLKLKEAQLPPLPQPEALSNFWQEIDAVSEAIKESQSLTEALTSGPSHPHSISGERLLTLMASNFKQPGVGRDIDDSEQGRRSSVIESDSAVSVVGHGKTEVDLVSMTQSWSLGVQELVKVVGELATVPRNTFMRELMENESLQDIFEQTTQIHCQNVEELEKMKTRLELEIAQLDETIAKEEDAACELMQGLDFGLPSLKSVLED